MGCKTLISVTATENPGRMVTLHFVRHSGVTFRFQPTNALFYTHKTTIESVWCFRCDSIEVSLCFWNSCSNFTPVGSQVREFRTWATSDLQHVLLGVTSILWWLLLTTLCNTNTLTEPQSVHDTFILIVAH